VDRSVGVRDGEMDESFEEFRVAVGEVKDLEAELDKAFAKLTDAAVELHDHGIDVEAKFTAPIMRALAAWMSHRKTGDQIVLPQFLRDA